MKKVYICLGLLIGFSPLSAMDKNDNSNQGDKTNSLYVGAAATIGGRVSMQDAFFIDERRNIFAVCDGHGTLGEQIAGNVIKKLDKLCKDCDESAVSNQSIIDMLSECEKDTEQIEKDENPNLFDKNLGGSTVLIARVKQEGVDFIWIGDSRGMVYNENHEVVGKTADHDWSNDNESERASQGGFPPYMRGVLRVENLAVSRAIGDNAAKRKSNQVIISDPETISFPFKKGDTIVLASDGLWTDNDNENVAKWLKYKNGQVECDKFYLKNATYGGNNESLQEAAMNLCKQSMEKNLDNTAVIVIKRQ